MKHLLTVEESYSISGRGLIVLPELSLNMFKDETPPSTVELRHLDGSSESVEVSFHTPRFNPSRPALVYHCMIKGKDKDTVPMGTEVWADF